MNKELKQIFIRATNSEGKWGSYSLQELLDMGRGKQIVDWYLSKTVGLDEAELITPEIVKNILTSMSLNGITVVKITNPSLEPSDKNIKPGKEISERFGRAIKRLGDEDKPKDQIKKL